MPEPTPGTESGRIDPYSGQKRRSKRLSDDEIIDRMFDAGRERVAELGVRVGLEHLSYETIIQSAGVSRTAVYRLWPDRQAFLGDLLCDLASAEYQQTADYGQSVRDLVVASVVEGKPRLETEPGRRELLLEVMHAGSAHNFKQTVGSPQWYVYAALAATVATLDDADLQARLREALRGAERRLMSTLSDFYRDMCAVFGYRLRPEFNGDFQLMAAMGACGIESMALRHVLFPEIVDKTIERPEFSMGTEVTTWSPASYVYATTVLSMIEVDPDWTLESGLRIIESAPGGSA